MGYVDCSPGVGLPRVGDVVDVFWDGDEMWYGGVVMREVSAQKGIYTIAYDDGEKNNENLREMLWRVSPEAAPAVLERVKGEVRGWEEAEAKREAAREAKREANRLRKKRARDEAKQKKLAREAEVRRAREATLRRESEAADRDDAQGAPTAKADGGGGGGTSSAGSSRRTGKTPRGNADGDVSGRPGKPGKGKADGKGGDSSGRPAKTGADTTEAAIARSATSAAGPVDDGMSVGVTKDTAGSLAKEIDDEKGKSVGGGKAHRDVREQAETSSAPAKKTARGFATLVGGASAVKADGGRRNHSDGALAGADEAKRAAAKTDKPKAQTRVPGEISKSEAPAASAFFSTAPSSWPRPPLNSGSTGASEVSGPSPNLMNTQARTVGPAVLTPPSKVAPASAANPVTSLPNRYHVVPSGSQSSAALVREAPLSGSQPGQAIATNPGSSVKRPHSVVPSAPQCSPAVNADQPSKMVMKEFRPGNLPLSSKLPVAASAAVLNGSSIPKVTVGAAGAARATAPASTLRSRVPAFVPTAPQAAPTEVRASAAGHEAHLPTMPAASPVPGVQPRGSCPTGIRQSTNAFPGPFRVDRERNGAGSNPGAGLGPRGSRNSAAKPEQRPYLQGNPSISSRLSGSKVPPQTGVVPGAGKPVSERVPAHQATPIAADPDRRTAPDRRDNPRMASIALPLRSRPSSLSPARRNSVPIPSPFRSPEPEVEASSRSQVAQQSSSQQARPSVNAQRSHREPQPKVQPVLESRVQGSAVPSKPPTAHTAPRSRQTPVQEIVPQPQLAPASRPCDNSFAGTEDLQAKRIPSLGSLSRVPVPASGQPHRISPIDEAAASSREHMREPPAEAVALVSGKSPPSPGELAHAAQVAKVAAEEQRLDEQDAEQMRLMSKSVLPGDTTALRNLVMGAMLDMPCFERLVESHRREQQEQAHVRASIDRSLRDAARRLIEEVKENVAADLAKSGRHENPGT